MSNLELEDEVPSTITHNTPTTIDEPPPKLDPSNTIHTIFETRLNTNGTQDLLIKWVDGTKAWMSYPEVKKKDPKSLALWNNIVISMKMMPDDHLIKFMEEILESEQNGSSLFEAEHVSVTSIP